MSFSAAEQFKALNGVYLLNTGLFIDDIATLLQSVVGAVVTGLLAYYATDNYKSEKQKRRVEQSIYSLKYIQVVLLLGIALFNLYLYFIDGKKYGITHRWKVGLICLGTGLYLATNTTMQIKERTLSPSESETGEIFG